jgi:glyoxylase I family protein
MDFPAMNGFGHIDLTVTDGERSAHWWQTVLGFQLVATTERPDSYFTVGLVMHNERVTDRFDERAVGLDHLAMRVSDRAALETWAIHLDGLGIEHSGVQEESGAR